MRELKTFKTIFGLLALVAPLVLFMLLVPKVLAAPTYTSTNYGIDEVYMGAGSLNNASSESYEACLSLGATGAGNSSSDSYQANAGPCSTSEPYLEFTVTNPNTDLGILSFATTATAEATFSVRTYLASGYIVINASDPPSTGAGPTYHEFNSLTSPTASQTGQEQFGINLVANTSPTTFGEDPAQIPSSSYSYGAAAADYDTTNLYKYVKGNTVAYSNSSSGTTNFTVSYIYNISATTPAGQYVLNHILVCVPTF